MPTPTEHKTVQIRILKYTEDIGWTAASRERDQFQNLFRAILHELMIAKTRIVDLDIAHSEPMET